MRRKHHYFTTPVTPPEPKPEPKPDTVIGVYSDGGKRIDTEYGEVIAYDDCALCGGKGYAKQRSSYPYGFVCTGQCNECKTRHDDPKEYHVKVAKAIQERASKLHATAGKRYEATNPEDYQYTPEATLYRQIVKRLWENDWDTPIYVSIVPTLHFKVEVTPELVYA